MGEHAADLPYEELVRRQEREELERERLRDMQDRKEAEELAKQEARSILELASELGLGCMWVSFPDRMACGQVHSLSPVASGIDIYM